MRNRGLKKGFENYAAWFPIGETVRRIGPTDLDAVIHNGKTHQYLVIEFKPRGTEITCGQFRALHDMTTARNAEGKQMFFPFVIWDEFSETYDLGTLPDDYLLCISGIKPNTHQDTIEQIACTLGMFRQLIIKFCENGFKE